MSIANKFYLLIVFSSTLLRIRKTCLQKWLSIMYVPKFLFRSRGEKGPIFNFNMFKQGLKQRDSCSRRSSISPQGPPGTPKQSLTLSQPVNHKTFLTFKLYQPPFAITIWWAVCKNYIPSSSSLELSNAEIMLNTMPAVSIKTWKVSLGTP